MLDWIMFGRPRARDHGASRWHARDPGRPPRRLATNSLAAMKFPARGCCTESVASRSPARQCAQDREPRASERACCSRTGAALGDNTFALPRRSVWPHIRSPRREGWPASLTARPVWRRQPAGGLAAEERDLQHVDASATRAHYAGSRRRSAPGRDLLAVHKVGSRIRPDTAHARSPVRLVERGLVDEPMPRGDFLERRGHLSA